jgi:hypothetical protein
MAVLALAARAAADEPKPWYQRFEIGAYADLYYAYNTNRPSSFDNFTTGEGTTAKKYNQFSLNLVALDLSMSDPVIAHVVINFGTATDVVHSAEPGGDFLGTNVWKFIQQAYVGYKLPLGRGLTVEAGVFPSHVGFEVFPSKDNWNYTRSWMAENSPYYQAGLRVSYSFTDRLSAQLHLLNGWQVIGEDNNWKTFGTQIVYAHPRFSLALNTLMGPEQPNSHDTWRFFFDSIATLNITDHWSLALTGDYGFEMLPGGGFGHFGGVTGYVRWAPRAWFALTARAEVYHDGLGAAVPRGLTGTVQTLEEGTLTFEFRVRERLILKIEGRYDHSDQPVFDGLGRDPLTNQALRVDDQGLIVIGAVATV